jgi:hypothetical protein
MVYIQGCNQMMDIITVDKVTFHPLTSHCENGKQHRSSFAWKICCTSSVAYMQGPAVVLFPQFGSQSKGGMIS